MPDYPFGESKSLPHNKLKYQQTANIPTAESTGINRPQSHTADMLQTDAITDHVLGMARAGFYSDKYAKDRIAGKMGYASSKHETQQSPVNPNKKTYKLPDKGKNPSKNIGKNYAPSVKKPKSRPTYKESYTPKVAAKWKSKGGYNAYVKAAKAYNLKNK